MICRPEGLRRFAEPQLADTGRLFRIYLSENQLSTENEQLHCLLPSLLR